MTLIIASIALAFALYFTSNVVYKIARSVRAQKDHSGTTGNAILACAFWGMFYYCTHL